MSSKKLPAQRATYRNEVMQKMPEIASFFRDLGFKELDLKIKEESVSINGKHSNGKNITIEILENEIYSEKTVTLSKISTPSRRVVEAKKLYKRGFTQSVIASRLGVSQKTISNDLKR